MSLDGIEVAGLIISILAIITLCMFISQNSFPAFKYAVSNENLIGTDQSIGRELSIFMWKNRGLDLFAQALILFGAAASCLAILRSVKTEENVGSK